MKQLLILADYQFCWLLLLAGGGLIAYAQTGGSYTLTWWTVDHGGLTGSTGGDV